MRKIADNIFYVGVNDNIIDLFESQFEVPNGISYNSYVIIDEKIAVFDTVDIKFTKEWLGNLDKILCGKTPDYLIIHHMEPDHSASIMDFVRKYPSAKIVGNIKTFNLMSQFFNYDFAEQKLVVNEGDKLSLGKHELTFIFAPMVHWPEVMMSYDSTEKILFSADAFGKFGAVGDLFDASNWEDEARRYYIGIVGKYGMQVQALLKKVTPLDIKTICSLHGPILTGDVCKYVKLYETWSSYAVETEGVVIAYTSIYGHTRKAVELLISKLQSRGVEYKAFDLSRFDIFEAVAQSFRYSKLVLATTTYNNDIFPHMRHFIYKLIERGYTGRTVAIIENGSWAPAVEKTIRPMFEKLKNITFTDVTVKIKSALNAESEGQIEELAEELSK